MAKKSRPVVREKKTAYKVRVDQRSDPKPKSKLARKLAKLPPPAVPRRRGFQPRPGVTGRDPDGALYVYDEQKAMGFADAPDVARIEAQPFLKWAGGKAQLLAQFNKFFPAVIDRYFEPFIGGGAVFFHLKARLLQMRAHLRDNNAELINAYLAVRDHPVELMERLDQHRAAFQADRERYYYLVRSEHQLRGCSHGSMSRESEPIRASQRRGYTEPQIIERAARMIFLNKTCFNGLYRVNARGEFNTPVGSAKNPSLYNRDPESFESSRYRMTRSW